MYRITKLSHDEVLVEVISGDAFFQARRLAFDRLPDDLLIKIVLLDQLGETGEVACLGVKVSPWEYQLVEVPTGSQGLD